MTTLTGWDAGDDIPLRLHIVPDGGVPTDGTTIATLTLTAPDGTTVAPAAGPEDGEVRARWLAILPGALAGEYEGRWTVTGTGAGKEPVTVLVGPAGAYVGRSYATTGQLAAYLHAAPPAGARRLLARATERVDELTRTACYDVDPDDPDQMPTDAAVLAALVEATCAQAEWLAATGDDGSGTAQRYSDVQIGSVRLSTGSASTAAAAADPDQGDARYAPGAIRALRKAGLYGRAPRVAW